MQAYICVGFPGLAFYFHACRGSFAELVYQFHMPCATQSASGCLFGCRATLARLRGAGWSPWSWRAPRSGGPYLRRTTMAGGVCMSACRHVFHLITSTLWLMNHHGGPKWCINGLE